MKLFTFVHSIVCVVVFLFHPFVCVFPVFVFIYITIISALGIKQLCVLIIGTNKLNEFHFGTNMQQN